MDNSSAADADPPPIRSHQPASDFLRQVVCRCCLSEDEMTDFLPLDSAAATNFRDCVEGAGESLATTTTTTLLDCLNGCARIKATLQDNSLPLHICADCCQALEACCEFIRCVRNADKILRQKQLQTKQVPAAIVNNYNCSNADSKVVDPKVEQPCLDSNEEQMESLPIGSLNLLDLVEDSQLRILGIDNALNNVNSTHTLAINECSHTSSTSSETSNNNNTINETADKTLVPNVLNSMSAFSSNAIYLNDFDFPNASHILETSKELSSLQNLKFETASVTNFLDYEVSPYINLCTPIAKDCKTPTQNVRIKQEAAQIDMLVPHTFLPPPEKDNSSNIVTISDKQSISKSVFSEKTSKNHVSNNIIKSVDSGMDLDDDPFANVTATKWSALDLRGCIYIVNAAKATDLREFYNNNQDKNNFPCMFCILLCDSKQALKQHLATHLGVTRYCCSKCNFECRFKYSLGNHLRSVHNLVISEQNLQTKFQEVSRTWTKYYCSICQKFFSSFVALQQHHHVGEESCFKCTHCVFEANHRELLMEHMAKEHNIFIDAHLIASYIPNATKPLPKSHATYLNRVFINQFIKFQTKEHKVTVHLCQYCGKSFQRRFHLLKHEYYVHSKDKRQESEKYFKRRSTKYARQQYTRHMKNTQDEHQFKCDICRRVFKTAVELNAHAQTHFSSQFKCVTCNAEFAFEFELKYHLRTHNTSNSSSPRYEYYVDTANSSSSSINAQLKCRLQRLKQHKQNIKLSSSLIGKHKPLTKRRLSLASVSTAKSSECSVNSPSNTNSDEDLPAYLRMSTKHDINAVHDDDNDNDDDVDDAEDSTGSAAISVADVMLPQPFHAQRNTLRRLSTSSSTFSINKLCATSSPMMAQGSLCIADKNFNCELNDQPYLNDFDLNLLDCSDDFLLDLSSL